MTAATENAAVSPMVRECEAVDWVAPFARDPECPAKPSGRLTGAGRGPGGDPLDGLSPSAH